LHILEPVPAPGFDPPPAPVARRPEAAERAVALLEVLLCSDYPTQIVIAQVLTAAGLHSQNADGSLNITFITTLSIVDSLVLVGLIVLFLAAHGERPLLVLFGAGAIRGEIVAGIPLMFVSLFLAGLVLISIQLLAPWLRTVVHNPLQDLLKTPRDAVIFGVVVVFAGGVREEIQRAFLLHRFEGWLGGGAVGVVVVSIAFGAGHFLQGIDAVIATGLLGAFWGVVYLRRRSAVAPMVAHAGFNLLQLAQFFLIGQ
jgi:membrane protease YdiL (CAAX protease family)